MTVASLPAGSLLRDIPVYLPRTSPANAHRLVTGALAEGVQVVMLCGPEPGLKRAGDLMVGKGAGIQGQGAKISGANNLGGKQSQGSGTGVGEREEFLCFRQWRCAQLSSALLLASLRHTAVRACASSKSWTVFFCVFLFGFRWWKGEVSGFGDSAAVVVKKSADVP